MLKAGLLQFAELTKLRLEGRLVGLWVNSLISLATTWAPPAELLVDLTEVTYVDGSGEEVLKWLASIGAQIAAETSYSRGICKRLLLPRMQGN
jgi:hypothetical protein